MPPSKDIPSLEESMAQLAENLAKFQAQFIYPPTPPHNLPTKPPKIHLLPPTSTSLLPAPSTKSVSSSNSSFTTPLPVKHLSPKEMQRRKAQELCFWCPEKFHHDHRCKPKKFLMIEYHKPPMPYANMTLNERTSDQAHNPDMGAATAEEQYLRHFRSHLGEPG
ncbi:hypothetical protein OSB04_021042 [Centaurea solstitialis]|uniref:Retrotransposon gag protein n=1 Tax=Centaurea solstitialis TaxID=347529 RepID=A0AA38SV28_9ASTR|nr:hypothetical protein OSB04_021042 [Centaurea solstitialis]